MISYLLGALFLGWSLGANDAANVFGTAVTSRMIRFSQAAFLASVFLILGAWWEGSRGMETLASLATGQTLTSAMLVALSAAIAVTLLTILKLPISTSQSAVGAIFGVGLVTGAELNWSGMVKIISCWVGTPIGGAILAYLLYHLTSLVVRRLKISFIRLDGYLRWGMILAGCYGAYALGANNVANVTGIFKGLGLFGLTGAAETRFLALAGAGSIALGICTFSRRVMFTVGRSLYKLDAFGSFVVVLAQALTVHFYAKVGVPVSSSQAIVGGVLGVVAVKGFHVLSLGPLGRILAGWLAAPLLAGGIAAAGAALFL